MRHPTLARKQRAMEWLTGYAVFHWIATWANPFCDAWFRAATDLGHWSFYYLAIAPLFWVVDRRRAAALFLLVLLSGYVNTLAKLWVDTPRPDPQLVRVLDLRPYQAHSNSFPSGHAQSAIVFWGYLAWWVRRRWVTALAVGLIAAISFSRLYLAVHFPIDILGGWLLGLGMLVSIGPLDRWADRGCPMPISARVAIITITLAITFADDTALTMISGSLVGFLAGASWLPQQPLVLNHARQGLWIVLMGLALQLGISSGLGWLPSPAGVVTYLYVAALCVVALWAYPRLIAWRWLRPIPATR